MQFTVTGTDLINAATQCTNTNEQIQVQIRAIQTYIEDLAASYQGPAATQLTAVSMQWAADAAALNTVLTEIASNLTSNARNYDNSETQNLTNISGVGATLSPARV